MLEFERMEPVFPDQPMWGMRAGKWSFIITLDEDGRYSASAKIFGARPFEGDRFDLGGYCGHKSFEDAVRACREFLRARGLKP